MEDGKCERKEDQDVCKHEREKGKEIDNKIPWFTKHVCIIGFLQIKIQLLKSFEMQTILKIWFH